jgi:hypothetical protein
MNEQPSIPSSITRMEIATIAAMLLGEIADDRKYTKACEEAVVLLNIAEEFARELNPELPDSPDIPWHLLDQDESQIKLTPSIREKLLKIGFNEDLDDLERGKHASWSDFWSEILHPPKPSKKRTDYFEQWLISEYSEARAPHILKAAKNGAPKGLVIAYLHKFPSWWERQKGIVNSASGKAGAKKKKSMGEKRKSAVQ